jgi:hypothetical protein
MLRWLGSPLFAPREVVLLERGALEQLPSEFRDARYDDDEGLELHLAHCRRGTEKANEGLSDAKRNEAQTYQAPFGWGTGDETTLRLEPKAAGLRWFATFTYRLPAGQPAARLQLSLTHREDSRTVLVKLPGGNGWMEARADLGELESTEYRLSFVKEEGCNALLDSFRVTRSDQREPVPGSVSVTSRKPNQVRLRARLTRPAFVVLSEVYYPGWEAFINGQRSLLLQGDYILRVVPVPVGDHAIELRFRPAAFRWGVIASLCFAVALALAVLRGRRTSVSP